MRSGRIRGLRGGIAGVTVACAIVFGFGAGAAWAQKKHGSAETHKSAKAIEKATERFAHRVDTLLGGDVVSKGEWGLLVADAETGELLFDQGSAKYFVPASNMKLFTTSLALDKLGPDFRFHTTLESTGKS